MSWGLLLSAAVLVLFFAAALIGIVAEVTLSRRRWALFLAAVYVAQLVVFLVCRMYASAFQMRRLDDSC